jgi:SAM-dependent methyltransferase
MDAHDLANLGLWNELAAHHAAMPDYGIDALRNGGITLREVELATAGDVSGLRVLHLLCHIGTDTLSWARLGAKATGVDYSPVAIAAAQEVAVSLGLDATFVCAHVNNLPSYLLNGSWDLVIATYGVLEWLSDLGIFIRNAHRALVPGGSFILVDAHPLAQCLWVANSSDHHPIVAVGDSYFETGGEPTLYQVKGSYADRSLNLESSYNYKWRRSLGEVISRVIAEGFRVESFKEFPFLHYKKFDFMALNEQGYWALPDIRAPLLFSLKCSALSLPPAEVAADGKEVNP